MNFHNLFSLVTGLCWRAKQCTGVGSRETTKCHSRLTSWSSHRRDGTSSCLEKDKVYRSSSGQAMYRKPIESTHIFTRTGMQSIDPRYLESWSTSFPFGTAGSKSCQPMEAGLKLYRCGQAKLNALRERFGGWNYTAQCFIVPVYQPQQQASTAKEIVFFESSASS